jgi:hypothetical protein
VLLEKEKTFNIGNKKRSWTESSVPGEDDKVGSSNYYIPIYSSGGGNAKLVMLLWFFDSRAGGAFKQTTADGKDVALDDFVAPEVDQCIPLMDEMLTMSSGGRMVWCDKRRYRRPV